MKKFLIVLIAALVLIAGTALAEAQIGDLMRVAECNEYITLRDEPSTSAAELDRVPLDGLVYYISEAENGFSRVSYLGQTGFVLNKYLDDADSYKGEAKRLNVTDEQRGRINLFLSNFSEQGFCWPAGTYTEWDASDQMLVDFAVDWHWFNKYDECIENGEYFNENNTRLAQKYLPEICRRYLGLEPTNYMSDGLDYKDGYYYWMETGGHTSDGFVTLTEVRDLGSDRNYLVYFTIQGAGNDYGREVYDLTSEEAQQMYPSDYVPTGCAILHTGEDRLDSRDGWYLSEWTVSYRDW